MLIQQRYSRTAGIGVRGWDLAVPRMGRTYARITGTSDCGSEVAAQPVASNVPDKIAVMIVCCFIASAAVGELD